jgi:hypothetical protein
MNIRAHKYGRLILLTTVIILGFSGIAFTAGRLVVGELFTNFS